MWEYDRCLGRCCGAVNSEIAVDRFSSFNRSDMERTEMMMTVKTTTPVRNDAMYNLDRSGHLNKCGAVFAFFLLFIFPWINSILQNSFFFLRNISLALCIQTRMWATFFDSKYYAQLRFARVTKIVRDAHGLVLSSFGWLDFFFFSVWFELTCGAFIAIAIAKKRASEAYSI